jgi:hypothetical protein
MEAAWEGAPVLRLSSKDNRSSLANAAESDPWGDLFSLPYVHAMMNANLATIHTVDPAHPGDPGQTVCQVDGVEANVIFTGIAGTKSQNPSGTGYGIPAVSIVQDILALQDGDHQDCLVLSSIPFPFSAGTTQSSAVTQCNQSPGLTGDIAGYVIDQLVIGALVAAANATGQQANITPTPTVSASTMVRILDELFIGFDKAMRTSVGDEINQALRALNPPIPFEITTGDLMAPFLVFSVTAFDKSNRTIDFQFNSVGLSTMLRTVDPQSQQVVLGTALSLQASGQGHLSEAGLDLALNYKFNVGGGLLPLGAKYAAQINAMILSLEGHIKKLFLSELDGMLFVLGGFPIPMTTKLRPLSATQRQGRTSSRWARSPKRRSTSLIP